MEGEVKCIALWDTVLDIGAEFGIAHFHTTLFFSIWPTMPMYILCLQKIQNIHSMQLFTVYKIMSDNSQIFFLAKDYIYE